MKKNQLDGNIEALRGFCAIMVLLHHCIIYSNNFNGTYEFRDRVVSYTPGGHLMVMVFFILSGYVIGLRYAQADRFNTLDYLKKRLTRLYPIYILAVLLPAIYFLPTIKTTLNNLAFGQNLFGNVVEYNKPLWSLNFEMVFYLMFIPVIKWRKLIVPVWLLFLCLSILVGLVAPIRIVYQGYLVGGFFWLTGYLLAILKTKKNLQVPTAGKVISVFFLLLSCDFLNSLNEVIKRIPTAEGASKFAFEGLVAFGDFALYPFCLYALITVIGIKNTWQKILSYIVYASVFSHLAILLYTGSFFKTNIFILPALFSLLSLFFLLYKKDRFSIAAFSYLGSISYALYVIHTPLQLLMGEVNFFSGTTTSYFVRLIILLAAVIFISHWLELKMQPAIKRFLLSKNKTARVQPQLISVERYH